MTALSFHLSCVPPATTHQRKKIVTIRTRDGREFATLADTAELNHAKALLEELLIPHQPLGPLRGPVVLAIDYTWPWLASHGKRVRAGGPLPHLSRPDLTNVTKTLEDRLTALRFIEDDRKVVDLHVRKWWGDEPGITVTIACFVPTSRAHTPGRRVDTLPLLTGVVPETGGLL